MTEVQHYTKIQIRTRLDNLLARASKYTSVEERNKHAEELYYDDPLLLHTEVCLRCERIIKMILTKMEAKSHVM